MRNAASNEHNKDEIRDKGSQMVSYSDFLDLLNRIDRV